MEVAEPTFQFGGVKIYCPYDDQSENSLDSTMVYQEICEYCQKLFSDAKLNGGLCTMFGTTLQPCHLERMNQNILAMCSKDVHLKCECMVGDLELTCDSFTLGGGQLSFDLTDYLVVMVKLCFYSIYQVDLPKLYRVLCSKVGKVQLRFDDQVSKLFIKGVNFVNECERPMAVCNVNGH